MAEKEDGAMEGQRREFMVVRGVCLEAVKNCGQGEWKLGFFEGRFGVLKFEMSLNSEEEEADDNLYGDGDGHGGSWPAIFSFFFSSGLESFTATVSVVSLTGRSRENVGL